MSTSRSDYLKPIDELVGHPGHTLRLVAHRDGVDVNGEGRWVNEYHCLECNCRVELSSV